ncbi:MAG: flagellar assembly peptidoglycan hydrolase FlgJ [Rhodoferax sp.]|nr:flagellar assembly peptidoglycan hydrolase FlgJ [Rhodoferax sp.]
MGYGSIYGTSGASSQQDLAINSQSLGNLKTAAANATPETIKETAKQFESLFMRELVKSMRDATVKSGMLDNPGSDLGTDLLDQQLAVSMSGQPGGLSDLIAQQLSRQMGVAMPGTAAATSADPAKPKVAAPDLGLDAKIIPVKTKRAPTASQSDFVKKHSDVASKVEKATGIPASFMLGQAGHETGWGRFEIKVKGGATAHNLFGIKAGAGWTGKVAEVTTTEYENGVARKQVAKFRAYDSYEDSFKDYARLISESPRYAKARTQTTSPHAFASGLQKAGYATDPEYAAKLSRAINTTLQLRRVQV